MQGELDSEYKIAFSEDGSLTEVEQTHALNTIKLIRYIAGLSDDVYLYDDYIRMAQAACKVNYLNGTLSHYPSMPEGMDYQEASYGIIASQNCNLAKYTHRDISMKYAILDGWMNDLGESNLATLGHRRWILNPSLGMVGFGAMTDENVTYNTMYVKDKSNSGANQKGVLWPAENMPVTFFDKDAAWSISTDEIINPENVRVELVRTSDHKTWVFSSEISDGDFYINNQDYGQTGCIIFKPNNISSYKDGDEFTVIVMGLSEVIFYSVNFFNLEGYYAPSTPSIKSVTLNSSNKPVIKWGSVKNAKNYQLYRRVENGDWKLLKSSVKATSYTDTSAGKGIKYYYAVASVGEEGGIDYTSSRSKESSVTVPLSKPTIKSAYAKAKKKNYISWNAVSKADGYKVYRRVYGTSTWKLMMTTTKTNYTNTSAVSGKKYQYRVRAFRTMRDNTVYGSYSVIKTIKTK